MINPSDEDIGRWVVYQGAVFPEEGQITSMNDRYVFVRFVGDVGSQACKREDLSWR